MTDEQLEAMLNGFMNMDQQGPKMIDVCGFPVATSPNLTPEQERQLIRAVKRNLFQFGVRCEWYGWSRCLWLAVLPDFRHRRLGIILFGLSISIGYHLRDLSYNPCKDVT